MKIRLFILLLSIPFVWVFGQSSPTEKHIDSLHFAGQHEESIRLRKAFMEAINDQQALERNQLKLKLSEYYGTSTWEEGLVLLQSLEAKVIDNQYVSDSYKSEFYGNFYHAYAYARQDWEKSLLIAQEFLSKIENQELNVELSKKTEVIYDIAYIFGEIQQPYEAINYYKKAESLYQQLGFQESSDMALLYNNLGFEYSKLSNFKKCNESYILATTIWEKNPSENAHYLATAYNNLIYNFLPYGELDKAEYYLSKLKLIGEKMDENDPYNFQKVQLSILLNELKILATKKSNACVEAHTNLFNYFEKIKEKEQFISYVATANNVLLNYFIENKALDEAENLALRSEKLLKKYDYTEGLLVLYSHIVVLKRQRKEYASALSYVDKALQISDKTIQGNLAGLYLSKGIVHKEMGNLKEAELLYKKAQSILDKEKSADFETLSHYTEIANFYLKNYEHNPSTKKIDTVFALYENCVHQFNSIYKNGLFTEKLVDHLDDIQEGLIRCAHYDVSKQVKAINYIENTTSRHVWGNFLRNNSSESLLNLDENYLAYQNLTAEMAYFKSAIQTENEKEIPNLNNIYRYNEKVLSLKAEIEQLHLLLTKSNSNYTQLFEPSFDLLSFIATLSPYESIVNFYPIKENLYAVMLNKNGIQQLYQLKNKNHVYQLIIAYREALLSKKNTAALGQELYESLLKNIPLETEQLTLISKDILSYLPFETLPINHQFLVEKYAIHYASSLSLYALQKNLKPENRFDIAVFAPDYSSTNWASLPFAEKEAAFLNENFHAVLYANKEATKSNFFNTHDDFNVFHLAMHAQVDNTHEEASKLIFEAEHLYFSDLYAEHLPLDLIVLSACDTGYGNNKEGEGIMSLSRAFTFAGVAASLHSLWPVPDKQGAELMHYFYTHLATGLPKNIALQQAKIQYLQSVNAEELKHPYYWAGFVLSGNPSALVSTSKYWIYIVVGLIFVVFLLVFRFKFRK